MYDLCVRKEQFAADREMENQVEGETLTPQRDKAEELNAKTLDTSLVMSAVTQGSGIAALRTSILGKRHHSLYEGLNGCEMAGFGKNGTDYGYLVRQNSELLRALDELERTCASLRQENVLLRKSSSPETEEKVKRLKRKNAELAVIAKRLEERARKLQEANLKVANTPVPLKGSSVEQYKKAFARQRAHDLAEQAETLLAKDKEIEALRVECRELQSRFGKGKGAPCQSGVGDFEQLLRESQKEVLRLQRQLALSSTREPEVVNSQGKESELNDVRGRNARLKEETGHLIQKAELLDQENELNDVRGRNARLKEETGHLIQKAELLDQVQSENDELRDNLSAVTAQRNSALEENQRLQAKLDNLEQVLKQMREVAERRQHLESEHEEALNVLRLKQDEVQRLQKAQVEAKREHEGVVQLLEVKVRELEGKCRSQSEQFALLCHELERFRLQAGKISVLNSEPENTVSAELDLQPQLTLYNGVEVPEEKEVEAAPLSAPASPAAETPKEEPVSEEVSVQDIESTAVSTESAEEPTPTTPKSESQQVTPKSESFQHSTPKSCPTPEVLEVASPTAGSVLVGPSQIHFLQVAKELTIRTMSPYGESVDSVPVKIPPQLFRPTAHCQPLQMLPSASSTSDVCVHTVPPYRDALENTTAKTPALLTAMLQSPPLGATPNSEAAELHDLSSNTSVLCKEDRTLHINARTDPLLDATSADIPEEDLTKDSENSSVKRPTATIADFLEEAEWTEAADSSAADVAVDRSDSLPTDEASADTAALVGSPIQTLEAVESEQEAEEESSRGKVRLVSVEEFLDDTQEESELRCKPEQEESRLKGPEKEKEECLELPEPRRDHRLNEYRAERSRSSDLSDILEEDEEELCSDTAVNEEGEDPASGHSIGEAGKSDMWETDSDEEILEKILELPLQTHHSKQLFSILEVTEEEDESQELEEGEQQSSAEVPGHGLEERTSIPETYNCANKLSANPSFPGEDCITHSEVCDTKSIKASEEATHFNHKPHRTRERSSHLLSQTCENEAQDHIRYITSHGRNKLHTHKDHQSTSLEAGSKTCKFPEEDFDSEGSIYIQDRVRRAHNREQKGTHFLKESADKTLGCSPRMRQEALLMSQRDIISSELLKTKLAQNKYYITRGSRRSTLSSANGIEIDIEYGTEDDEDTLPCGPALVHLGQMRANWCGEGPESEGCEELSDCSSQCDSVQSNGPKRELKRQHVVDDDVFVSGAKSPHHHRSRGTSGTLSPHSRGKGGTEAGETRRLDLQKTAGRRAKPEHGAKGHPADDSYARETVANGDPRLQHSAEVLGKTGRAETRPANEALRTGNPGIAEGSEAEGIIQDNAVRIFVALFAYDPASMSPNPDAAEEELPFKEGQIIKETVANGDPRLQHSAEVLGKTGRAETRPANEALRTGNPGIAEGSEAEGIIQDNAVRIFVALFAYDPASMSPNPDAAEEELPFKEGQIIKFLLGCFQITAVNPNELPLLPLLLVKSAGVWEENVNSHRECSRPSSGSQRMTRPRRMVAVFDYDPRESSPNVDVEAELTFSAGDVIVVFGDMDDDGFFYGDLNGQQGLAPSNFLQALPENGAEAAGGLTEEKVLPAESRRESQVSLEGSEEQNDSAVTSFEEPLTPCPMVGITAPPQVQFPSPESPGQSDTSPPGKKKRGFFSKGKKLFKKLGSSKKE
ncbi:UNVERIFIED_CONTAM: hypothetical protein FKN15_054948 [Acipenser sinensis]